MTHNIFICYSRSYFKYRDLFIKATNPSSYNYDFKILYDRNLLNSGNEHENIIIDAIKNQSHIVVLLITKDFFDKPYIRDKELPAIKKAYSLGKINIIPIIIHKNTDWKASFEKFDVLPLYGGQDNALPVVTIIKKLKKKKLKEEAINYIIWNELIVKNIMINIPEKTLVDDKKIELKPNFIQLDKIPKEIAEKVVFLLRYTIFSLSKSVSNKTEIMNYLNIDESDYYYLIKGKRYELQKVQEQYNRVIIFAIKQGFFKDSYDAVKFYQLNLGTWQEIMNKSKLIVKEHTHFLRLVQQYSKRLFMQDGWFKAVEKLGKTKSKDKGLNSKNELEAIETMTKIYSMANQIFKKSDMELFVISDFDNALWDNVIDKSQEYIENNINKDNKLTHLHAANTFIGNNLTAYISEERQENLNKTFLNKTFKIVEGGVGGANTSHKVLKAIIDKCQDKIEFEKIEYLGFEVNQKFAEQADDIFKGKYKHPTIDEADPRSTFFGSLNAPQLLPLPCPYTDKYKNFVINEDLSQGINKLYGDYEEKFSLSFNNTGNTHGDIDLFVFSYVFHHISNGNALRKMLFSNHTKELLNDKSFDSKIFQNRLKYALNNYIKTHYDYKSKFSVADITRSLDMKDDAFDTAKFSTTLADSILELLPFNNEVLLSEEDTLDLLGELEEFTNSFMGISTFSKDSAWVRLTINYQKRLIHHVWELLRPGGYLAIADPDGYSKFNKTNLSKNAEMGVAHFLNRKELCELLQEPTHRFNIIGSWTQVKEKDVFDVTTDEQNSNEIPKQAEDDYNLGYIVIAQKPFDDNINQKYRKRGIFYGI